MQSRVVDASAQGSPRGAGVASGSAGAQASPGVAGASGQCKVVCASAQGSPRGVEAAGASARAQAAGVVGASAHGRVVGASAQGGPRGAGVASGSSRAQATAGVVGASAQGKIVGASAQGGTKQQPREKRGREELEIIDLVSPPRVRPPKQRRQIGSAMGPWVVSKGGAVPMAPLQPSGHGRSSTTNT